MILISILLGLVICTIFGVVINNLIVPKVKYSNAIKYIKNKEYRKAEEILENMKSYKDCKEQLVKIKLLKIDASEIGDIVEYGEYEQDDRESNGKEPIDWIVLDKKDGKVLIISRYCIDCKPYNIVDEEVTWETCTLRRWLNDDFIKNAFNKEEKSKIISTLISNADNFIMETSGGNDTEDRVFLLSIDEVEEYFTSDDERATFSTYYAREQGADFAATWWLRSPGGNTNAAADVWENGNVGSAGGVCVDHRYLGIRPALWISVE